MASIIQRGKSFSVIYYHNGKQKWESFKTKKEANDRKIEIEYKQMKGIFTPPSPANIKDFLAEYVEIYGTTNWGHSTFSNNIGYINNYVNPNIGEWKMKDVTTKKMDSFFSSLKLQNAVKQKGRSDPGLISNRNIYEINKLLSNAFNKAVDWEYIGKNPVTQNACPKRKDKIRSVWEPQTAKYAISICDDLTLLLCMHLSIACSMRIGEITGLKWQFVSFGDANSGFEEASLQIDVQLQRISNKAFETLSRKKDDIKFVFPSFKKDKKTLLVLKSPKTASSKRIIWIPQTTAKLLWQVKNIQDKLKESSGDKYKDFDLVIAYENGKPIESGKIEKRFKEFIIQNGLPDVEFHSLRHLSTTVKLIISKGDIKAVQGDTGHAQAKMVIDTYAHILDNNRKETAKNFEREFYGIENLETPESSLKKLLSFCLKNPEVIDKLLDALEMCEM